MALSVDGTEKDPLEKELRQACAELDGRIRAGEAVRAEEFLGKSPALANQSDLAVELIYSEFVAREEAGEPLSREAFYRRFPQWKDDLLEQFQLHDLLKDSPDAPSRPSVTGQLWSDRYQVMEEIGRGGMAVVYRAHDTKLNRAVAVKVLLAGAHAGRDDLFQLVREAQAVASLQHPHIVQVYEVGDHDGWPFLALEYVEGPSLAESVQSKPPEPTESARLVEILARAAHFAHERGMVHRDLKPTNVLIDQEGRPKITDFGLAKRFDGKSIRSKTESFVGTPQYMAPEQAGVLSYVGPSSDVYSLGAILYECTTQNPPFPADSVLATAQRVVNEEPVAPRKRNARIPRDLEIICLKCLEKEPYKRYATAEALADDLARFLAGQPILARPPSLRDRIWKWARRHPAAALLCGVIVAAASLLLSILFWYTTQLRRSNRQLEAALGQVGEQRTRAENQAELYREQLDRSRHGLYALQLLQVQTLWQTDPGRGMQLLMDEDICRPELRDFTWRDFYRLCRRESRVLAGHPSAVSALQQSRDGKYMAAICDQGGVVIWNQAAAKQTGVIKTDNACRAAAFGNDNQSLYTVDSSGAIQRWSLVGKLLNTLIPGREKVAAAQISVKHNKTVLGSPTGEITCRQLTPPKVIFKVQIGKEPVTATAMSPDGNHVAVALADSKRPVVTLSARSGKVEGVFDGANSEVHALAYSPDGATLASGGRNETVELWDAKSGRKLIEFSDHISPIQAVAFSPDGLTVASASSDRTVKLWRRKDGTGIVTFKRGNVTPRSVQFSLDGKSLLTGGSDRTVRVWRTLGRAPYREIAAHKDRVLALAISRDGAYLASSGKEMTAQIWNLKTGEQAFRMKRIHRIRQFSFSPDGKLLAAGSEDRKIRIWDVASGSLHLQPEGHLDRVFSVAYSPDGKYLASGSDDQTVRIWDQEGMLLQTLSPQVGYVSAVAFSPDSASLAAAGRNGRGVLWNVSDWSRRFDLKGHTDWVHCAAISPDGKILATGSSDETIRFWDVATGKTRTVLRGHTGSVNHLAFSPDGKTFVSSTGDRWVPVSGEIRLWDAQTGHLRATFAQSGPVAFSPDGRWLATGTDLGKIRLWEAAEYGK